MLLQDVDLKKQKNLDQTNVAIFVDIDNLYSVLQDEEALRNDYLRNFVSYFSDQR